MEDAEYIKLILKDLSGSINSKEKELLDAWVSSNEENKKTMTIIKLIWAVREEEKSEINTEAAWTNFAQKAGILIPHKTTLASSVPTKFARESQVNAFPYRILRYAAVFLLSFALVYLFKTHHNENYFKDQQEVFVHYGKQSTVTLSDGTFVMLDAGSILRFPKKFSANKREVYLTGEAYFKVRHNALRPFVIHANQGIITVLGTEFNVRAWQNDDGQVQVVVLNGKVALKSKEAKDQNGVIITKDEMSYLAPNQPKPSAPVHVDVEPYVAWMKRELILRNTPLSDVLDRLSRWYNLEIQLPNPIYKRVKVTGTFKKKSLDYILNAIGLMVNLQYKKEGGKVVFYKK